MKTKLAEINISKHDASDGTVELHFPCKLNRHGRRLASDVASGVRGLDGQLVIVGETFMLKTSGENLVEQKRVADSFMRAWSSALSELDDERLRELTKRLPVDPSTMAVSSGSGIFHTAES